MLAKEAQRKRRLAMRQAARQLLLTESYEAVTYTAIAEAAGFTRNSAPHIYPSKAELFAALYRHEYDRWATAFVAMVTDSTQAPAVWLQDSLKHDGVLFRLAPLLEPLVLAELRVPVVASFRQYRFQLERKLSAQLDDLRDKTVQGAGAQLITHTLWTLSWIYQRRHGTAAEANAAAVARQYELALRRVVAEIARIRPPR